MNLNGTSIIGQYVEVHIDRPLGSVHPKFPHLYYPIHYGYVKGIMAPDGDYQDAYVLGVKEAMKTYRGVVIAVIHRENDVEEKWVVAPRLGLYSKEEIIQQVYFQEQYFKFEVRMQ